MSVSLVIQPSGVLGAPKGSAERRHGGRRSKPAVRRQTHLVGAVLRKALCHNVSDVALEKLGRLGLHGCANFVFAWP